MTRLRCIHLNDDFAMGGVVKALSIFEHPLLSSLASSSVRAVNPRIAFAPRLDADVIITHFPPSWSSLAFSLSASAAQSACADHPYRAQLYRCLGSAESAPSGALQGDAAAGLCHG